MRYQSGFHFSLLAGEHSEPCSGLIKGERLARLVKLNLAQAPRVQTVILLVSEVPVVSPVSVVSEVSDCYLMSCYLVELYCG